MAILASELIAYASANVPTDDTSTSGGAIDATRRVIFTNTVPSTQALKLKSDGADVRVARVTIRKADGTLITENVTLNGTTAVTMTNSAERVTKVDLYNAANTAPTSDAARTVTVYLNDGTTVVQAIPPNEIGFLAFFTNSSSDPSTTKTRYEKFFMKNTNGTLALQTPTVQLTTDASGKLTIALANANDDTGSVANRTTLPGSITAFGTTAISVPAGSIASGAAVGVWVKQALSAGDAPIKNTFQTTTVGQST
jgi:hypothetical protein